MKLALFATDQKLTFLDQNQFQGNIYECIEKAVVFISKHMRWKADIGEINRVDILENLGNLSNELNPILDSKSGTTKSIIKKPIIANVLYRTNMIEAFETGFTRVFELCNDSNVKYKFDISLINLFYRS